MALEWTYSSESIDWEELHSLYEATHMGQESAADLKAVFSTSIFSCFAYEAGKLVAAARALQDREGGSYICGVAVHPQYQGLGIGRELMTRLVMLSGESAKIYLHAAPGKESFYRKPGFKPSGTTMTMPADQIRALASAP